MRLVFVLVLAILGCGKERRPCAQPRASALAEVDAHLDQRRAEHRRMSEQEKPLSDRYSTLTAWSQLLFAVRDAFPCSHVQSLATQAQPSAEALDDLRARAQPGIDAGRTLPLALVGPDLALDAETTAAMVKGSNGLAVALEPWTPTLVAPLRPGRPWSAAQRRYLTWLAARWCEIGDVFDPVIDPRVKVVLREAEQVYRDRSTVMHAADAYQTVTLHAFDAYRQLAADEEVALHDSVADDPAFASVWPAIKAYNLCRK